MNTSTITPQIASFAEAVRDALHDLPAEEREELTDGLEADLAEAFAEDLQRELPDPVEYATELRNAAGLPKSENVDKGGIFSTLAVAMGRTKVDLASVIDRNPALAPVADFLVAIRPLWWLARAWIAFWIISAVFGYEFGFAPRGLGTLVLLAFAVISIQWGRGRWIVTGVRPLIVIGNVIAALLLIPVAAMANDWTTQISYPYYDNSDQSFQDLTGVYLDGTQVTNIFPYDAAGKPIKDVQLFDQDGKPLSTSVPGGNGCLDEQCDTSGLWAARVLESGASVFNVFPLSMVTATYGDDGVMMPEPNAVPQERKAPLLKVPAVEAASTAKDAEKVAPSNE